MGSHGEPLKIDVFVDTRAVVKSPSGAVILPRELRTGDSVRFWLKPLMMLSEPAKGFADSVHVIRHR